MENPSCLLYTKLINFSIGFALISLFSACDDDKSCHTINLRNVYLSAFRDPELFDEQTSSMNIEDGTSQCFRDLSQESLDQEQEKLLECGQILSGSPLWNECHNEAEALNNNAVILRDIANTIDGRVRFENSSGGQYLIFSKGFLGASEYNLLIDLLESTVPDMKCEVCD